MRSGMAMDSFLVDQFHSLPVHGRCAERIRSINATADRTARGVGAAVPRGRRDGDYASQRAVAPRRGTARVRDAAATI